MVVTWQIILPVPTNYSSVTNIYTYELSDQQGTTGYTIIKTCVCVCVCVLGRHWAGLPPVCRVGVKFYARQCHNYTPHKLPISTHCIRRAVGPQGCRQDGALRQVEPLHSTTHTVEDARLVSSSLSLPSRASPHLSRLLVSSGVSEKTLLTEKPGPTGQPSLQHNHASVTTAATPYHSHTTCAPPKHPCIL